MGGGDRTLATEYEEGYKYVVWKKLVLGVLEEKKVAGVVLAGSLSLFRDKLRHNVRQVVKLS